MSGASSFRVALAVWLAFGCGPGEPRLDPGLGLGGNAAVGGFGGASSESGGSPLGGATVGGGEQGGAGGSGGQADLGEVAFELFITKEPVDPLGEGGKAVPYYVRVCVSAGGTNNHVAATNLGDAPAGPFAITATLLGMEPSFGVEIGSCTIVDSVSVEPDDTYFWTVPGCCQIVDHLSTFDASFPRKIRVTVDADDVVDESDESNNEAESEPIDIANDAVATGFNG